MTCIHRNQLLKENALIYCKIRAFIELTISSQQTKPVNVPTALVHWHLSRHTVFLPDYQQDQKVVTRLSWRDI